MEQILKRMFNFDVAEEDVESTDSDSVCNEELSLEDKMNKALNAEPNCKKAANCNFQFDKELEIFMNGGPRGVYLNKIYQSLLTIAPTRVEGERCFSASEMTI